MIASGLLPGVRVLDVGQGISGPYCAKILAQMGRSDWKPKILNAAHNEIPHQYLSSQKARKKLGWKPRFNFDEGLKLTIPWYEEWLAGGADR